MAKQSRAISAAELARRVGVPSVTAERLLRGETWPAGELLAVLAEELEHNFELTRNGWREELWQRRAREQDLAAARPPRRLARPSGTRASMS